MDWVLAMASQALWDRLQQRFELSGVRMMCFQAGDENSQRMSLKTPAVHLSVRHESGFFSTDGEESTSVLELGKQWQ